MRTKRRGIKTCLVVVAVCISLLGIVSMAEAEYFTTALGYDFLSNYYYTYGQYCLDAAWYYLTQGNGNAAATELGGAYSYWYDAYEYAYDAYVEAYYGYEAIPITIAYYAYIYAYYDYYYRNFAWSYVYYASQTSGGTAEGYAFTAAAYAFFANYCGSYAAYYEGLCSFGGWA
jgi:hypothetical protein